MDDLRGSLLLAAGGLFDPNFRQTVVLVAEHGDEGALGVVLNHRTPLLVADVLPALAGTSSVDDHLYKGGPVQPNAAVVLADFEHPDFAGRLIFGSIGIVTDDPKDATGGIRRARVYSGYAGWEPGQLDIEMERSDWIVEPALPDDVFCDRPADLWRRVLVRKGADFELLARMPFDPSAN